jgi:hypothetical protein
MVGVPRVVSQCATLHVAGWTWAVFTRVYLEPCIWLSPQSVNFWIHFRIQDVLSNMLNLKICYCVHNSPPLLCTYPEPAESPPRRFISTNRSSKFVLVSPPLSEPRVPFCPWSVPLVPPITFFHLISLIIMWNEKSQVYHPQKLLNWNYGLLWQFSAVGILCC